MDFEKRYAKLNKAQKQAVDTIDGPVMVIAGPGTGKTELLSVRTANILQKTDTLPENILCLTYTDNGANAMRERLTEIIGKDAYKVAVHTFHSFGTEVINQNGQYFYQGAHFHAADDLGRYEIMRNIFENLDYNNPIATKLDDDFTHLSDSLKVISELKKSGLVNDELLAILDENNAVIEKAEQLLAPIFAERVNKNTASQVAKHIKAIKLSNGGVILPTVVPLSVVLADSLETATNEAISLNSTKPMTAWKSQWFQKDESGNFIFKSRNRQTKLRELCSIYGKYLNDMQQNALYDYDDMILRVVHAMEVFDDLRFNLQEKYQYIMVDEFQDTNMAQMRILHNLTNNVAHGDTPNIMVVGDDDQAIYSFQGADISNIIDFQVNYPRAKHVVLTENYRSTADILASARDIISQGTERLENRIEGIDKSLTANNKSTKTSVFLHEAETISDERHWIITDIKARIKSGQKPNSIAVFTRRHKEINSILPYFSHAGINVSYERRDNVLELAPIKEIEQLSHLLIDLANGRHDDANARLPEILAHESWEIAPLELWKLSVKAYDNHTRWLDIMAIMPEFKPLHNWLVTTASMIKDTPLEQMLDIIVGNPNLQSKSDNSKFVSPFYNYFFSDQQMADNPSQYLIYLEALRTIRSKLREYHHDHNPTLPAFVEFIALNRKIGTTISAIRQSVQIDDAVNLMTAHSSKGLEFDTVYVMNAVDTVWGGHARSKNRLINYPENLPLAPAGETNDERLRLFYVAITRAKQQLHISYSHSNDKGKDTLRTVFLLGDNWQPQPIKLADNMERLIESAELAWYQPLTSPTSAKMRELLVPKLENYKLSVTHLNNFLDVTRGGPSLFLLQNLLRFPQSMSPNAAFGTAIHNTLQNAHAQLASTSKHQAIEDIVSNFELNLRSHHLLRRDFETFLQKGSDALQIFLDNKYSSFTSSQQSELDFASQHSMVGNAHLSGKLDLVDIDRKNKTIAVTDYKTGKPLTSWNGKTEYEKIKLHKIKQQVMFYKLLVENARDYRGYKVDSAVMQFIEPTTAGDILSLETEFDKDELDRFAKLVNTVWTHIIQLNLPDVSSYDHSYKGILAFEQDLIDNIV